MTCLLVRAWASFKYPAKAVMTRVGWSRALSWGMATLYWDLMSVWPRVS